MTQKKVNVLNVPVTYMKRNEFLNNIYREIEDKKNPFIVTANPEIIMLAKRSPSYHETLMKADYIIPDGIGVILASNILGNPLPEKIPGYDLLHTFLAYASENNKSVYFFGAKEGVADAAAAKTLELYPHIKIAGTKHGYSGLGKGTAEEIASTKPDFIFIGLGAPLQEKWIADFKSLFPHSVLMGVGGSFDVLSGNTKRAPEFWLNRNLEWLHRLITQPFRAKRMMKLPFFVAEVYKQKFFSSSKSGKS